VKKRRLPDFIIIDDDPINNMVCNRIIQLTIDEAIVNAFTEPTDGLEFMLNTYSGDDANDAVLFLDINMPLNGWEVLDMIEGFPEVVKGRIKIFMLSSSVNPSDKEKAGSNPLVSGYIPKSLSQEKLKEFFPDMVKTE